MGNDPNAITAKIVDGYELELLEKDAPIKFDGHLDNRNEAHDWLERGINRRVTPVKLIVLTMNGEKFGIQVEDLVKLGSLSDRNRKIRQRALAKLTEEEKKALGV